MCITGVACRRRKKFEKQAILYETLNNLCGTGECEFGEQYNAGKGYVVFIDGVLQLLELIEKKAPIDQIENSVGKTVESITFTNY